MTALRFMLRSAALASFALPLAGCFSYTEVPSRPPAVVVQQPATSSTTTTTTQPAY